MCEFKFGEMAHEQYTRDGINLKHVPISITLSDALIGYSFRLNMINGQTIPVQVQTVIKSNSRYVIKNGGLPHPGRPNVYGDLFITFNIIFPVLISGIKKTGVVVLEEVQNTQDNQEQCKIQ